MLKQRKVHFDLNSIPSERRNRIDSDPSDTSLCGLESDRVTPDPEMVTCRLCRKTLVFKGEYPEHGLPGRPPSLRKVHSIRATPEEFDRIKQVRDCAEPLGIGARDEFGEPINSMEKY